MECDNHMWRVGNRPLPKQVTIDGGSDWIAINRRYGHYLVTGDDNLLVRIKRIFEFSLLPAEVVIVTVYKRSHMCVESWCSNITDAHIVHVNNKTIQSVG